MSNNKKLEAFEIFRACKCVWKARRCKVALAWLKYLIFVTTEFVEVLQSYIQAPKCQNFKDFVRLENEKHNQNITKGVMTNELWLNESSWTIFIPKKWTSRDYLHYLLENIENYVLFLTCFLSTFDTFFIFKYFSQVLLKLNFLFIILHSL